MYIERRVSDRGVAAYYFLERKTKRNTGWSLSQQEYDQAMRVGAFISVAQMKTTTQSAPAKIPEPTYYQKAHDHATGRTVGQSRTAQTGQHVAMRQGSLDSSQMPDNTAGFSMSYASNSAFFKDTDSPAFNTDVLQEQEPVKKKGFIGRIVDGLKAFFLRPAIDPPTTKALPAPGETSSPNAPILNPVAANPVGNGRHYRTRQDADVPTIPRGRG